MLSRIRSRFDKTRHWRFSEHDVAKRVSEHDVANRVSKHSNWRRYWTHGRIDARYASSVKRDRWSTHWRIVETHERRWFGRKAHRHGVEFGLSGSQGVGIAGY